MFRTIDAADSMDYWHTTRQINLNTAKWSCKKETSVKFYCPPPEQIQCIDYKLQDFSISIVASIRAGESEIRQCLKFKAQNIVSPDVHDHLTYWIVKHNSHTANTGYWKVMKCEHTLIRCPSHIADGVNEALSHIIRTEDAKLAKSTKTVHSHKDRHFW